MKKILGLALAAFMVMGLVGGGTWAYFTDPESVSGSTLAAGTLDLEVNSENPWTTTPVFATGWAPGETSTVNLTCENTGSIDGDLWLKITGVTDDGGVETYAAGDPINGNVSSEPEAEKEIALGARADDVSSNVTLVCEVDGTPDGTLDGVYLDSVPGAWTKIQDDLAGATSIELTIGGTLSVNADNRYQGDNTTFTIELMLTQVDQSPS